MTPRDHAAMARTSARARVLIEALLKEMQRGLKDPAYRRSEVWEELYGNKQSLVVNLQKLVQALASLPSYEHKAKLKEVLPAAGALNKEEIIQLMEWVQQSS